VEGSKNSTPAQIEEYDEVSLRDIVFSIWSGKWIIIAVVTVCFLVALGYAIKLPNIYKSEVLLSPVSEDSNMRLSGQLGGLAALAGVNVGGGAGDKTTLALEILKSRDFIGRFIQKYDLFAPVMAAKSWDRDKNTLLFDSEMYDEKGATWVRKVSAPFAVEPSLLEAYKAFKKILKVAQDKKTRMVRVSIEHYSPFLAAEWLHLLVTEINEEMRKRDSAEAERSISYLNQQIGLTALADAKTMLYSLIEEQTKSLMLTNVRSEYVFKTVDPAVVPETKDRPKRVLILLVSVVLGSVLGVLVVLIRNYFGKKTDN